MSSEAAGGRLRAQPEAHIQQLRLDLLHRRRLGGRPVTEAERRRRQKGDTPRR